MGFCVGVLILLQIFFGDYDFLNLDKPFSLPSWFASIMLFSICMAAILIARLEKIRQLRDQVPLAFPRLWYVVGLIFFYFSLDTFIAPGRSLFRETFSRSLDIVSLLTQSAPWPIMVLPVLVVLFLSLALIILRRFVPHRTPLWLTAAGLACWLGVYLLGRFAETSYESEDIYVHILRALLGGNANLVGSTLVLSAFLWYVRVLALDTTALGLVRGPDARRWMVVTGAAALLTVPLAIGGWAVVRNTAFAHTQLGESYRSRGQWVEAAEHYRKALARDPENARAHHALGVALYFQSKIDEAIDEYQKALALKADYVPALRDIGVAYYRVRRYDDAIQAQRKILEHRPTDYRAHLDMAKTHQARGDFNLAIETLQRALQYRPKAAKLYLELGDLFERQGDTEQAMKHWQKSLRLRPRQAGAKEIQQKVRIYQAKRSMRRP